MQIIQGGLSAFNGLVFGLPTQDSLQYFQQQASSVSNVVGEYGTMFKESVKSLYDKFTNAESLEIAKRALQHANASEYKDVIRPLYYVTDFQTAMPVMQRWVMANPVVREYYHKQQCDGYSGTYVDDSPNRVGDNHYDYRRVMDGVVRESDEHDLVMTHYYEDLHEGGSDFSLGDKKAILKTWDIVEMMFKAGQEDPTNPFGGNL